MEVYDNVNIGDIRWLRDDDDLFIDFIEETAQLYCDKYNEDIEFAEDIFERFFDYIKGNKYRYSFVKANIDNFRNPQFFLGSDDYKKFYVKTNFTESDLIEVLPFYRSVLENIKTLEKSITVEKNEYIKSILKTKLKQEKNVDKKMYNEILDRFNKFNLFLFVSDVEMDLVSFLNEFDVIEKFYNVCEIVLRSEVIYLSK